jgi:ferric-dicitrate binding protein FerR (iron transport regulator)
VTTQGGRRRRRQIQESPDDTSLLGLAAVWSELEAPMPPKRKATHRHRAHGKRAIRPYPAALLAGLAAAVFLAVAMITLLPSLF